MHCPPGSHECSSPQQFGTDPSLPGHTIYQPERIAPGMKAPVIAWSNGGYLNVGTIIAPLLLQLASHAAVVVSNGDPEKPELTGRIRATAPTAGRAQSP